MRLLRGLIARWRAFRKTPCFSCGSTEIAGRIGRWPACAECLDAGEGQNAVLSLLVARHGLKRDGE